MRIPRAIARPTPFLPTQEPFRRSRVSWCDAALRRVSRHFEKEEAAA